MPTGRARMGRQSDGVSSGMRCSLRSFDVSGIGDPNSPNFSFNSDWTNIIKPTLTGTASVAGGSQTPPGASTTVSHGLGYVPFVEVRLSSGNTINDDLVALTSAFLSNRFSGVPCTVNASSMILLPQASGTLSGGVQPFVGYTVVYSIFQVPVPNPS